MQNRLTPRTISIVAAAGLLVCSLGLHARAAGINGEIDFDTSQITFNSPNSLATATEVMNWTGNGVNVHVTMATGDFATYQVSTPGSPGDVVSMTQPWVFNSGTPGAPLPGPATSPLWTVDGFTFALASSNVTSQSSTFLNVRGVGTISGNGFDPTPGVFSFTSTGGSESGDVTFGFTAETFSAIPEPSTWVAAVLALFVAIYSQRRKVSRLLNCAG